MRSLTFALVLAASLPSQAQPPSLERAMRELQRARVAGSEQAIEAGATGVIRAAAVERDHPALPIAIGAAAHAYAELGRLQTATRLWQRVIDEGAPRLGPEADEQLVLAIADAYQRLGDHALSRRRWQEAAARYRTLADSPVFVRSRVHGMGERVVHALAGASEALEALGQPLEAARHLRRAAEADLDEPAAPGRLDRAAVLFERAGAGAESIATSERLLLLYSRRAAQLDLVVRAHERIARLHREPEARRRARQQQLTAFERLGGRPGTEAAALAARSALALAEAEPLRVVARGGSARVRARRFERSLAGALAALAERVERYERVLPYRSAEASLAALVALAEVAGTLADSVAAARVPAELREPPLRALRCRAAQRAEAARALAERAERPLPATAARALERAPSDCPP